MKKIVTDNIGSVIPLLLFVMTIFVCGALYSLFFIEVAYPELQSLIPAGDAKVYVMMLMYAIPLFVIVVGVFSLLKAGLKRGYGI